MLSHLLHAECSFCGICYKRRHAIFSLSGRTDNLHTECLKDIQMQSPL